MPKCLNDATKSYKGNEPSPKGLGYSAGKLESGTIKNGKDGNFWIVKELSTGSKRWTKHTIVSGEELLNLDNGTLMEDENKDVLIIREIDGKKQWDKFDFGTLPDDCYVTAYIPECELIKSETGLEEKFGGKKPFFTKGEEWPEELIFLCQFKDPRNKDDVLYQVFVSEDYDFKIKKVSFTKADIKKQIIIESKDKLKLKPFLIKSWSESKELVSFKNLINKLSLSSNAEKLLWDKYYKHDLIGDDGLKVGGTPVVTQGDDYDKYNLLQLSESKYLKFGWGDAGIAHVSEKLELVWDCC
jgi:hypothetical protein